MPKTTPMRVCRNPQDGLWYVVAPCGRGKWMAISSGSKTEVGARSLVPRIRGAEVAQRSELLGL